MAADEWKLVLNDREADRGLQAWQRKVERFQQRMARTGAIAGRGFGFGGQAAMLGAGMGLGVPGMAALGVAGAAGAVGYAASRSPEVAALIKPLTDRIGGAIEGLGVGIAVAMAPSPADREKVRRRWAGLVPGFLDNADVAMGGDPNASPNMDALNAVLDLEKHNKEMKQLGAFRREQGEMETRILKARGKDAEAELREIGGRAMARRINIAAMEKAGEVTAAQAEDLRKASKELEEVERENAGRDKTRFHGVMAPVPGVDYFGGAGGGRFGRATKEQKKLFNELGLFFDSFGGTTGFGRAPGGRAKAPLDPEAKATRRERARLKRIYPFVDEAGLDWLMNLDPENRQIQLGQVDRQVTKDLHERILGLRKETAVYFAEEGRATGEVREGAAMDTFWAGLRALEKEFGRQLSRDERDTLTAEMIALLRDIARNTRDGAAWGP